MMAAGALILIAALLPIGPHDRMIVFWCALALAVVPPIAFSYLFWRRNGVRV